MAESFTLLVPFKNEEKQFNAELRAFGYTHKIAVNVNETEIIFEPDEERNYRAVIPETESNKKIPDVELIRAIAATLETAFKD